MQDTVMEKSSHLFIVGTDTGVGKSVLSLLLMQYFYAKGHEPFYIKPFQTGCTDPYDTDSDAKFIYTHVTRLRKKDPADSVIYCLPEPKAPYFAGRDQGVSIDVARVREVVTKRSRAYAPLIIEAAGGLLVPVNEETLVIDTIKPIDAKPVLAARTGLGTINHTLLSLEALQRRGLKPAGVVLVESGDEPSPEQAVRENMAAIEKFSNIRVAGVIPHIHDFANPGDECFQAVERMVDHISTRRLNS